MRERASNMPGCIAARRGRLNNVPRKPDILSFDADEGSICFSATGNALDSYTGRTVAYGLVPTAWRKRGDAASMFFIRVA